MVMHPNADTLLARLAPWQSTLQLLDPPTHRDVDEAFVKQHRDPEGPHVVWFSGFKLFRIGATPEPLDVVCEALSLLALLARVDLSMWKALLLKIWPSSEDLDEWLVMPLPESFVIGLDMLELSSETYKDMQRFQDHAASTDPPSREYLEVRKFIATMDENDGESAALETIRVRLELECIDLPSRVSASMLHLALKLVKDQAATQCSERAPDTASERPRFNIVNVDFLTATGVVVNLRGLRCLLELMRLGIPLSHLPAINIDPTTRNAPILVQILREIVGLDGDPNRRKLGARSLSINDEYSEQLLNGLLTAAQHSSIVETLEIEIGNGEDLDFADQRDLWRSIASTIFCPGAQHNIQRLTLNAEMLQDVEVDAVRETLEAVTRCASTNIQLGPGFEPLQIVASRFTLDNPEHHAKVVFVSDTPLTVDVLDTPGEDHFPWYQVELPAHGTAWVHMSDVISTSGNTINPLERLRSPAPGFPRIDITHMTDDSKNHVAGLLELIGHETEHITYLDHFGEHGLDGWCERVLAVCPKLDKLLLHSSFVANLELFCTAASEGHCQLRKLYVSSRTGEDAAHIQAFFNVLSNPTHPLADHLRELHLTVVIQTENPQHLVGPVLRMLQANRRLLDFTLVIEQIASRADLKADFRAAFDAEAKRIVWIRSAPLELCSKLAFLSCVNYHAPGGINTSHAINRLDASLVAIIFQFAAHGQARRFSVRYGEFLGIL